MWRILVLLVAFLNLSSAVTLVNVDCGSYVDYIPTDPHHLRYLPYYVSLHRCHGTNQWNSRPLNYKCWPDPSGIQALNISTIQMSDGTTKNLTVYNHTICNEKCVLSCNEYETFSPNDCTCQCNYPAGTSSCKKPFTWDKSECDCVCPHSHLKCDTRKDFNKTACGCVCKDEFVQVCPDKQYFDNNVCACKGLPTIDRSVGEHCKSSVSVGMFVGVIFLEAFFFFVLFVLIYTYCFKKKLSPMENKNLNAGVPFYVNRDV